MINFKTTQDFINNFSGSVPVGTIVQLSGFYSPLDGGAASWAKTAVTGTASQTPEQLGGGLLNDAGGNQWELLVDKTGVWMEQFGVSTAGDNVNKIVAAMNYVSINLLGELKGRPRVYPTSPLVVPVGVRIKGGVQYTALNVQDIAVIAPEDTGALVIQAVSGSTGNFIFFNSDSYKSSLDSLIVDARNHTGDVLVCDALDSVERRAGNEFKDCLVYGGTGRQLFISVKSNETRVKNSYFRGGSVRDTAQSNYGIYDESQDSKFESVFSSFHKIRCIYDAGGAGRRENIDTWGSQECGIEIVSAVTYYRLQSDGNNWGGVRINNAKHVAIFNIKTISNGHNQPVGGTNGDVEIIGDCRGSRIIGGELRGTSFGTLAAGLYKDDTYNSGISITDLVIATGYTLPMNKAAEAYFDMVNVRSTSFPFSFVKAVQTNPNIMFNRYTVVPATATAVESLAPTGWTTRNHGTSALSTEIVPVGYRTAVEVFSAPDGTLEPIPAEYLTSGIQFEFTGEDLERVKGARVRLKMLVRGSASTYLGNQFIEIRDGVGNPQVVINNNATWEQLAMVYDVPAAATLFQVRLIAANVNVPDLSMHISALTIEIY